MLHSSLQAYINVSNIVLLIVHSSCRRQYVRMRKRMAGSRDDRTISQIRKQLSPFFAQKECVRWLPVLVQCSVSSSGQQMS